MTRNGLVCNFQRVAVLDCGFFQEEGGNTLVKALLASNFQYSVRFCVMSSRKGNNKCGILWSVNEKEGVKMKVNDWLRPLLFAIGGALVGLGYYYAVGCSTGSCPITSNPIITMIYMGVIGLLLSGLFGKGCDGKCNM